MADAEGFVFRIRSDLSRIRDFLIAKENIINAHNVDFFTRNLWETCLSEGIREDLDKLSEDQIALLPFAFLQGIENPKQCSSGTLQHCSNLLDLFSHVRSIQLKNLPYVKQSKYFEGVVALDRHFASFMMSPKKSYEVGVMCQAVYDLVQNTTANKVVDLGSGKGYLSQYLSLKHGIPVMGIDSRESNTKNAEKRNEKTLKAWHFLLKRNQNLSSCRIEESCDQGVNDCACRSKDATTRSVLMETDITGPLLLENELAVASSSSCAASSNTNHTCSCAEMSTCQCKTKEEIHNISLVSKKETLQDKDIQTLLLPNKTSKHYSYLPVTAHVSSSAQMYQNLGDLFENQCVDHKFNDEKKEGVILVGLHTCGDLAPTAINIFIKDSFVKALCLVGCCYHLLSQPLNCDRAIESEENPDNGQGDETDHGFPMSDFLKQQNFRVSRNATMVAQQAADRIASEGKTPPRSIFYRAVLQVILREKFDLDTNKMHVGRVGAKCKTFTEYVYKAFKKLGLENKMISDEEIQSFYERFQAKERQIKAFHQLRACIAPCIESLFLMDRLCYLHEKGINDAQIVAMFDPVKSPRCYAIIASKAS